MLALFPGMESDGLILSYWHECICMKRKLQISRMHMLVLLLEYAQCSCHPCQQKRQLKDDAVGRYWEECGLIISPQPEDHGDAVSRYWKNAA